MLSLVFLFDGNHRQPILAGTAETPEDSSLSEKLARTSKSVVLSSPRTSRGFILPTSLVGLVDDHENDCGMEKRWLVSIGN